MNRCSYMNMGCFIIQVFGFQVGVSKHDIDAEDPMILNILPACNMSLFGKQSLVSRFVCNILTMHVFHNRVRTKLENPRKSLNLETKIQDLEIS